MIMSKSKLMPLLIERGFIEFEKAVSYEAFGKKVFAYIPVKDMSERSRLESFLRSLKVPFNRNYYPGAPVVEARVSYFKAWHWDE